MKQAALIAAVPALVAFVVGAPPKDAGAVFFLVFVVMALAR